MAAATSAGLSSSARCPAPAITLVSDLAGDALGDPIGIAARHDRVLLAPDQQRRRIDQLQPLLQLGVAERPEDARGGLIGARLLDRPFDRIRALGHRLQRLPDLRIGAHQPGHRIATLRPRIGRRIGIVEQPERRDQRQPSHARRPQRRHLRGQRRTDRTAGEIRPIQPGLGQQIAHREQPVEMRIQHGMTTIAAGKARQRRHDHGAAVRQFIEERHPARQAAEAGEKAQFRPAALAPDAGGKAVDIDGQRLGFAHVMLPCCAALTDR